MSEESDPEPRVLLHRHRAGHPGMDRAV